MPRAAGGEWQVERQRLRWDVLDAFAQAAQQAGIPATSDFNTGSNEGVGYFEVNQKSGWRWNTANRHFAPALHGPPHLTVWTQAQVSQLLLQTSPMAASVAPAQGVDGGEMLTRRREVVLSAGAIGSPQLLQLSGIGPAACWRTWHCGQGRFARWGQFARPFADPQRLQGQRVTTLNTLANSLWGKACIGLEYALKRSGPMSMAPQPAGALPAAIRAQPWPNIEYHVQPLSLEAFGEPLHSFPAITASVCNLNPTSRGTVHIRSARFWRCPGHRPQPPGHAGRPACGGGQPAPDAAYCRPARAGSVCYRRSTTPGTQFQTDDELVRLAGDIATTIFHSGGHHGDGPRWW